MEGGACAEKENSINRPPLPANARSKCGLRGVTLLTFAISCPLFSLFSRAPETRARFFSSSRTTITHSHVPYLPPHFRHSQLRTDFGSLKGYAAPKEKLRGSILSLSSTSGGGRGSFDGNIIGDVINHGKRKYWGRGADYFYHCTLKKGENTLEAQVARVMMRSLATTGGIFTQAPFVQDFIKFMTTPGSHNDTYASTYLRMFFEQHAKGASPDNCPGNDGHNVDTVDALTVCGVLAVTAWGRGVDVGTASDEVETFLRSLRKSDVLPTYGNLYTELLYDVLDAPPDVPPADAVRAAATKMAAKVNLPLRSAVAQHPGDKNPMTACYMSSALPALLIILHKYADDPAECLLASARAGGENVARGSALGTILGAAYGKSGLPDWLEVGLLDRVEIAAEIAAVVAAVDVGKADGCDRVAPAL
eukprot:m.52773 g.52773  ORF g.52773 m.52773 type:complete len:420 (+) comp16581_c0_seq2:539-1798(+)